MTTVPALREKPPGTPYLEETTRGEPKPALRVAEYVSELSRRATSNAPVFDGGTGSEGAWAPPQKDGVPSLRMDAAMGAAGAKGSGDGARFGLSAAFTYGGPGKQGDDVEFSNVFDRIHSKKSLGAMEARRRSMTKAGSAAAEWQVRRQKSKARKPGSGQFDGATAHFLVRDLQSLGKDDVDVRSVLALLDVDGLSSPQWVLDNMHCALEIFAHGFHNLVGELIKLALEHAEPVKGRRGPGGTANVGIGSRDGRETAGSADGRPGSRGPPKEKELEDHGAAILLKSWALMLQYAERLTLAPVVKTDADDSTTKSDILQDAAAGVRARKGLSDDGEGQGPGAPLGSHEDKHNVGAAKENSIASLSGPLARVAFALDGQQKRVYTALARLDKQLELTEASRAPLLDALEQARIHVKQVDSENRALLDRAHGATLARGEAEQAALSALSEQETLRKEIQKLAMLPVKVSELTRRMAINDMDTTLSQTSLGRLKGDHATLKDKYEGLLQEFTDMEEALERSKNLQAGAERSLNHALDAKRLAEDERTRAEKRASLASMERNTAQDLYEMAEKSLSTARERLQVLESSDKDKTNRIRVLEEQLSHYSALSREREIALMTMEKELGDIKVERDTMKKEFSFLSRSSTSQSIELAKMERDFGNQIEAAKLETKRETEKYEEAASRASALDIDLQSLRSELEGKETAWSKTKEQLEGNVESAKQAMAEHQKKSETMLAEYTAKWRRQEEELSEEIAQLRDALEKRDDQVSRLEAEIATLQAANAELKSEGERLLKEEEGKRLQAEEALSELAGRLKEKVQRGAELAESLQSLRSQHEKVLSDFDEISKLRDSLKQANDLLQYKNAELSNALSIEIEAHLESRGTLELEIYEVREYLNNTNQVLADAETALVQLSLGIDLQSICPAGVTPAAYSSRVVGHLRTPTDTPPSRQKSIQDVRNEVSSRLGTPIPTLLQDEGRPSTGAGSQSVEPQIMVINQEENRPPSQMGNLSPLGSSVGGSRPVTSHSSRGSMPVRPSTSLDTSSAQRAPALAEIDEKRPKTTHDLPKERSLMDDLRDRIIHASQLAGKPLSELKSEKARIQIQNMLKHKTTLYKGKMADIDSDDLTQIDVKDMRWVDKMAESGMTVLEFHLAKDGHYWAKIPEEAGFWRFSADRKMHVTGIETGFPGLILPPLAPDTYEKQYGEKSEKRRQDPNKMSSKLKETNMGGWLKTHTQLRTSMDVKSSSINDVLSI